MSEAAPARTSPSLRGWLLRDASITAAVVVALWTVHAWHAATGSWLSTVVAPSIAFVSAYSLCYIYHEWGHLIGTRLAGGHMPLAPYSGVVIGGFDITGHTRRQFLWLSWGGVIAYFTTMTASVAIYFSGMLGLTGAGLALGGLAFACQSLSVDLPQIWQITRGADIAATSAAGSNATIILRRTWQSWTVLALAVIAWNKTL